MVTSSFAYFPGVPIFHRAVKMEFLPLQEYETAGLALVQSNNFQFRLEHSITNGQKVVRLMKCTSKKEMNHTLGTFSLENIESKLAEKPIDADEIYLMVTACGQDYNFYYGASSEDMKLLMGKVDGRILSSDVAGGYAGTFIGMFASSNGNPCDNNADFDWFDYNGN